MHTPPQPRVEPRPANASRATILICDDDAVLRAQFAKSLRRRDYDVLAVASVDDALDLIDSVDVDRAVVDLKMPERSGLELVEALARREPPIPCVVLTGYGSIATALEAVRLGATHYLTKPADVDEVLKALDEGLDPAPLEPNLQIAHPQVEQLLRRPVLPLHRHEALSCPTCAAIATGGR